MKTVKLGDICNLMTGGTPSKSHKEYFESGTIKWLVSGDIHESEIFDCDGRITEIGLKNSNARLLPINSVMIALNGQGKTRATVALLRTEATCNQSLVSIYPKDDKKVLPEWIFWNLRGRYEELRKRTGDSGNERRGLNMIILRDINIPEPPSIEEQRRLVARLDAAFEKIDRAIELTEKNIKNTGDLRAQIIEDAMSKSGGERIALGDFCNFENGDRGKNYPSKSKQTKTGIPFINAGNLNGSKIDFSNMSYISEDTFEKLGAGKVKPRDILFCLRGSLGKFGSVGELQKGAIASSLVIVRPDLIKAIPDYLLYYFEGSESQRMIAKFENGTAQPNLSAGNVKKFDINLPKIAVQESIVGALNEQTKNADSLRSWYERKKQYLISLKQSLLTQAFSQGEVE